MKDFYIGGNDVSFFDSGIASLLSLEIFNQITNNQSISVTKLNFALNVLIKNNIPFDISFSSGNRKDAASVQLTIHIMPTTTLVFVINLEPGASVFSPSP